MPVTSADRSTGGSVDRAGAVELTRRLVLPFAIGVVVLVTATIAVGLGIERDTAGLDRFDLDVSGRLAAARTPFVDGLAELVGTATGPFPVVAACVAVVAVSAIVTRRWTIPAFIGVAMAGEALVFLLASVVVARPRPPVDPIGQVYATSSFPSGHVGFAVIVTGGALTALLWHRASIGRPATRTAWTIVLLVTIAFGLIVGFARVWSGQHHVTDVVWGSLLGALWLALAWRVVLVPATGAPPSSRVAPR